MEVATEATVVNERFSPPPEAAAPFQPQPSTVEETGIDFGQLIDLCVKTIYFAGRPSARTIAARLALPFSVVETVLAFLKKEQYIEIVGSAGMGEQQYQYALSGKGADKAAEALERNQYVGPAPVPFETYLEVVARQSVRKIRVDSRVVEK